MITLCSLAVRYPDGTLAPVFTAQHGHELIRRSDNWAQIVIEHLHIDMTKARRK